MFKYKSEAELEKMTPEQRDIYSEQKRAFEAESTKQMIAAEIAKAFPAKTPEQVKAEADAAKAASDAFEALKEDVQIIKERTSGAKDELVPFSKAVASQFEAIKTAVDKNEKKEFVIKANVLRASVGSNQNSITSNEIGQLAHRKITVYDLFRKIPIGKNANGVYRYYDWDQATTVRAAAAIAEAGTFPESTAVWAGYTAALKKVGDSIPVSEEFMYDAEQFAAELEAFLLTNVDLKIDTDLITGNNTGANLNGLSGQVPNYTPVASGITDASIYDLLVKVKETIAVPYGGKYNANVAIMNLADINKMKLKKDANNNYVMPPFFNAAGQLVDGLQVIECNAVTANTMFVGDSRFGFIIEEPGIVVAVGENGTDFLSDMKHLKVRRRLELVIRNVDRTGWLEVTSISAALTTLAT